MQLSVASTSRRILSVGRAFEVFVLVLRNRDLPNSPARDRIIGTPDQSRRGCPGRCTPEAGTDPAHSSRRGWVRTGKTKNSGTGSSYRGERAQSRPGRRQEAPVHGLCCNEYQVKESRENSAMECLEGCHEKQNPRLQCPHGLAGCCGRVRGTVGRVRCGPGLRCHAGSHRSRGPSVSIRDRTCHSRWWFLCLPLLC